MKLDKNVHISLIILAGGASSRMGYPKPWLKNENGITFLNEIITSYEHFGIDDVIVVLNENFTSSKWNNELSKIKNRAIVIKNDQVEKGRLHSLQLGLNNSTSDFYLIHNVDNPFVEYKVLDRIIEQINFYDIIIPTYNNKGGHPVIIGEKVKSEIVDNYQEYNTLKDIFSLFEKNYVPVDSNTILTNINTPQDLEALIYEPA